MHSQAMDLYRAGSLKEAAAEFEKARDAWTEQGNQVKAATVSNDLGVVYYLMGRRDDARLTLTQALAVFEKEGNALGQAKAVGNLAQLMNKSGDKENAEKHYTRAADLFHQVGERTYEYDTLRALSQMRLQRGRWLEALSTYDHALAAKGGSGALRSFLQIPLKILGVRPWREKK